MFRSQGQESTAFPRQPTSWTGRALVLEIKHERDYTRGRGGGQTRLALAGLPRGSPQLRPHQRRAGPQRLELGARDLARQGNHAAIGAGIEPLGGHVRRAPRESWPRPPRGVSTRSRRDVDGADQHVLALRAARSAPAARASSRTRARPGRSSTWRAAETSSRTGAIPRQASSSSRCWP